MTTDDHVSSHERGEFLEAVYDLTSEGHQVVDVEALADRAGLSAPQAAALVADLSADGLVEPDAAATAVRLTATGQREAVRVIRRHRLAERMLRDVIGLEWWKIHHEAVRWENVISDDVEERLVRLLGDPGTCPHGNPIPGSVNRPDQSTAVRLADAPAGPVSVVRITEDLEEDDAALQLLERAGVIPGRPAEIVGRDPDGTVHVVGAVADAHIPPHVASRTYVDTLS
jgi:DtxR family transcriptional regulator, Mn-dependent transcriptional regulator